MTTYLVTGAGSGIGAALARSLASQGVVLALVDRGPEHLLREVAESCRESGAKVAERTLDVCDAVAMGQFIQEAADIEGRLDFVIANAGLTTEVGADGLSVDCARELIETNYLGALHTLVPASKIMQQQGFGGLVAITSIGALVGTHSSGAYSASKAALMLWTDSLRLRLKDSGVHVTNIVLGFVETPMTQGLAHAQRFWIQPDKAAQQIIKAVQDGGAIVSIPFLRNSPWWLMRAMPYSVRNALLTRAYRHFNAEPTADDILESGF